MLYVDASVLVIQDMATPKEMVDRRLKELGWSKAKLAKKLGYQTGYQDYYSLFVTNPHQLTKEKLIEIAKVLGKPDDWLQDGGETSARKREHYIRAEFEKYLQTEVGRSADPETHKILESMQWTGQWLPSVRLYQSVQLTMEGKYTPAQMLDAMELEAADRKAVEEAQDKARQDTTATMKRVPKSR
jgi:transcriptional regulator with XRE-family HTH domain